MSKLTTLIIILFLLIIGIIFVRMQPNSDQTNQTSITPTVEPSPLIEETPTPQATASDQMTAIIKTSKGEIVLSLFPNEAPKTVANFVDKAQSGYYNNLIFHRVEDWVIQGGDPLGNGTGGGTMPTEFNDKVFVVGSLGVARGQNIQISNDSQFFITKTEASWLNGQYTNFGLVTGGLEVVNQIEIGDKILEITIK